MDAGSGFTILCMYLIPLKQTLIMFKIANLMLYILLQQKVETKKINPVELNSQFSFICSQYCVCMNSLGRAQDQGHLDTC